MKQMPTSSTVEGDVVERATEEILTFYDNDIQEEFVSEIVGVLSRADLLGKTADGWRLVPVEPKGEQLRFYGYAPGHYLSRCIRCGTTKPNLDKRATSCEECARIRHKLFLGNFAPPAATDGADAIRSLPITDSKEGKTND